MCAVPSSIPIVSGSSSGATGLRQRGQSSAVVGYARRSEVTVIGDAGRIENMGDGSGDQIHIWESRRSGPGRPDAVEVIARADGGHGGADPSLVEEFLRFARAGGTTDVSAVAAREAVATGVYGAESIRSGGVPLDVPAVPQDVRDYFDAGQS